MAPKVTLYVHGLAPNPPKVAILLEELGVEYAVVQKVCFRGIVLSESVHDDTCRILATVLMVSRLPIS